MQARLGDTLGSGPVTIIKQAVVILRVQGFALHL